MNRLLLPIVAVLSGLSASAEDTATRDVNLPILRSDIVDAFRTMPIFDERVKPFETFARLKLLRYSGYTSAKLELSGETRRLDPTEWLLASLFYPDDVVHIPLFLVDDSRMLTRLGVKYGKARDRFSYADLEPAADKILEFLQKNLESHNKNTITSEDARLWDLCMNFRDYQLLRGHFDFARHKVNLAGAELPDSLQNEGEVEIRASDMLLRLLKIRATGSLNMKLSEKTKRIFGLALEQLQQAGRAATTLRLLPGVPEQLKTDGVSRAYFTHWTDPGSVILRSFDNNNPPLVGEISQLAQWENMYAAFEAGPDPLWAAVVALNTERMKQAATSGGTQLPGPKLAQEVSYHRADYFFRAGLLFTLLFLFLAISWLVPRSGFGTWMRRIGAVGLLAPLAMVVTAIAIRISLLNGNPVTSLYETIPFITAVGVAVCLVMEWRLKSGLASGIAAFVGLGGMSMTYLFETQLDAGEDTLKNLQAVLLSNFWLRTHVTSITIGYSGGVIAVLFSSVYLLRRVFGFSTTGSETARTITRMTYGALAFCLLFSIVGTILGGIWANYSWGRFWGWDPKENGAFMICLWVILIIHARLGGYLREAGLHCATLILGTIISFSWFGVNQLSIGLHAYGFNEKLQKWLNIAYGGTLIAAAICAGFWIFDGGKGRKSLKLSNGK